MCSRWVRTGRGASSSSRPSQPRPGQLILDLAAGTGTSSEPFAHAGAMVVPTDLSLGMLQVGKARKPDLSFVAADALQLPYADASFDAVTISFGLRNVEDTAAALEEMRRVTKPGGTLVVCEFSTPTWRVFRAVYANYLVAAIPKIAVAGLVQSGGVRVSGRIHPGLARPAGAGRSDRCGRVATGRVAQPFRRSRGPAPSTGSDVIALDPPVADAPATSILLGSYAARSCPVKTQNAFNPTVNLPRAEPSDALAELFEGGAHFEAVVLEKLITSTRGRVVDLRLLTAESRATQIQACVRAMESGAALIIGGCLPVDLAGHRVGYPDLLVRGADSPSGTPAYHPAEVKWHKIIERVRRPAVEGEAPPALRYSTLEQPAPADAIELAGHGLRTGSRWADLLQLAHYHRMLESCGHAATPPLGAIIGTDTVTTGPVLVWAALDQPMLRTFSRSRPEGWRLRSPLERYDHEHAFRVDIAAIAQQQTGDATQRSAPAGRADRECGMRALPVVGALPPQLDSARCQPAHRQGSARHAGDRHAAPARHLDDHRPGRRRPGRAADLVSPRGHPPAGR